jgi:hypothetical protein
MSDKIFIKAPADRLVLDPMTHVRLAPEGEWKPRDVHWVRKLLQGDVVECVPPSAPAPLPSEESTPVIPSPKRHKGTGPRGQE